MSDHIDGWVRDTFGADPFGYGGGSMMMDRADAGGEPPPPPEDSPDVKKIKAAIATLQEQIKLLKESGVEGGPLDTQAAQFQTSLDDSAKIADENDRAKAQKALRKETEAAAKAAVADVKRQAHSAVEGTDGAVKAMLAGAKKQIDKLDDAAPEKSALQTRLDDLNTELTDSAKLTDRADRGRKLAGLNGDAQTLFDDASAATGDDKDVQKTYENALKERYGFKIKNPKGTKNTHFDGVYKMFDKVPVSDVVQDKLQKLTYEGKPGETGASFGSATIEMGEYGAEDWGYTDPKTGTPAPSNGFNISTLHELGHSVDERYGIMSKNQGKAGGGGWKSETVDTVAAAMVADFTANAGAGITADAAVVTAAAKAALGSATVKRPKKLSDDDWLLLEPFLNACVSRREKGKGWNNPVDVGGRNYHEAYSGEWWSCDFAARSNAGLKVRNYQWRSPAEWFAELYAFSFFKSDTPPSAVDSAIAAYMYGGATAAPPSTP